MGTSQSHPGASGSSPLIPPWADDQPGLPIPDAQSERFRDFRRSFGTFVSSGDRRDLRSALGHYARTSSGGRTAITRKLGAVTAAGDALYGALTSGIVPGTPSKPELVISELAGQPTDTAIARIADAIASTVAEKDKVRAALNQALSEALEGIETFDIDSITEEIVIDAVIGFLAEAVFLQIVSDVGDSWQAASSPREAIEAEDALRELARTTVDQKFDQHIRNNREKLDADTFRELERNALRDVWEEWEAYR